MTESVDKDAAEHKSRKHAEEVSGQNRLAINLTARWLGQIVVIISGFVIPRLIDRNLGAASLGIWDFAWSTVSYFRFMGLGLAGGLNRFVALYSASEAHERLKSAVSSTYLLQMIVALLTLAASVLVAALLHLLFRDMSPTEVQQSRWVVFFLGANLAVRMLFWPARSILTGYHFWTTTSAVTAVGDTVLLLTMYLTLKMGGGLANLGFMVFINAVVVESVRMAMAKRIYPFPVMVWSSIKPKMIRKMLKFGITNSLTGLPNIVALQTTSIFLAASAGPAALAVYARPLALFNHIERLIKLYAFLLTPMAASLQGLRREHDIRKIFLSSLMSSFAMTLPPILVLAGYGDVIVKVWMGQDYVIPVLAPILGIGLLFPYANSAALRILVGVDAHAKISLWSFLATSVVLIVAILFVNSIGWSAPAAAIVVGASLCAGPGITVLVGSCRKFGVGVMEYLGATVVRPLLCNLILLAVIIASRAMDDHVTLLEAAIWSMLGGITVLFLYWNYLLTDAVRAKLRRKFLRRRPAAGLAE